MAALDCNQTNSFITLQQNYLCEKTQTENLSACNVFDRLPNEVIQNCLAPNLTPNEALTMRLLNRRFAILFGDKHVWRIYYNIHGLKLPENNPIMANELTLSCQAKQFNFWRCFKKEMDQRKFEEKLDNLCRGLIFDPIFDYKPFRGSRKTSRSLFIKILATSELSLLHEYALQILKAHSLVPAKSSVKEIMLRIANKDKGFEVDDHAHGLATCFIAKYAAEPRVKQVLISILSTQDFELGEEHAKAIVPHVADPLVQEPILMALRGRSITTSIKFLLDALFIENPKTLENPEVIELLIDSIDDCIFYRFFHNHLGNPTIVKQLVQRLCNENDILGDRFMVVCLILALEPIADQAFVQQAFCEGLLKNLRNKPEEIEILSKTQLTNLVKEKYGHLIPELQELIDAEKMLNEANHDKIKRRQLLLNVLMSGNPFVRNVAVNALASLVPFDPVIRATLLERIMVEKSGKVGAAIISVLSTIACNKDIREIIIQKGLHSWGSYDAQQRFNAAVQALSPFAHELEVLEAFMDAFKRLTFLHQELFDILAVQLDKQDVLDLFLTKVRETKGASLIRIAAIDKLGKVVSNPKVQTVLLQVYAENDSDVKAACIRALCNHSAIPMMHPAVLIKAFNSSSWEVSLEAIRALRLWLS